MFRDSRYKLNVYHGEQLGELYDMQEDPQELNNLWDDPDYGKVRMDLTDKLLEWMFRQELANGARGRAA